MIQSSSMPDAQTRPTATARYRAGRGSSLFRSRPLGWLLWVEPIWLVALAPSILFPGRFWMINWHPTLVLLLFLFWPLRLVVERRLSVRTPLNPALALLLLWLPAPLLSSIAPLRSWQTVGYLLLGVSLYVALVNWPPARRRPQWIGWALLALGAVLAVLGPMLITPVSSKLWRLSNVYARFGSWGSVIAEPVNPNVLAGALLVMVPFAVAVVVGPVWRGRIWPRLLVGFVAVVMLAMLALTQSRGALAAALLALGLVWFLHWPRTGRLVAILAVLGAGGIAVAGRLDLRLVLDETGKVGNALVSRTEIWSRAILAMREYPLLGIGPGLFDIVIPGLHPYPLSASGGQPHAHNLLLQIGVDLGLLGLVAMLAIYVLLAIILVRNLRILANGPAAERPESQLYWSLCAGALASFGAVWLHGLVDAVMWGTKVSFLPWLLAAMATNIHLMALSWANAKDEQRIDK